MPSDEELRAFPWEKLTWLIVNEGEAGDLCGVLAGERAEGEGGVVDVGGSEGEKAYTMLSAYPKVLQLASRIPKTNVVCTLGSAGVLALVRLTSTSPSTSSSHSLSASNPEIIFLPAAKLQGGKPVDTTGAGDCFTGYMVAGLIQLRERSGTGKEGEMTREGVEGVLRRCVQVRFVLVFSVLRRHARAIPLSIPSLLSSRFTPSPYLFQ